MITEFFLLLFVIYTEMKNLKKIKRKISQKKKFLVCEHSSLHLYLHHKQCNLFVNTTIKI